MALPVQLTVQHQNFVHCSHNAEVLLCCGFIPFESSVECL